MFYSISSLGYAHIKAEDRPQRNQFDVEKLNDIPKPGKLLSYAVESRTIEMLYIPYACDAMGRLVFKTKEYVSWLQRRAGFNDLTSNFFPI